MQTLDRGALGEDEPAPPPRLPPKVLHIVETMGRGAIESLLLRALEHAHAAAVPVNWSFYCILPGGGTQVFRAEALGARVLESPVEIGRKLRFMRALRRELKRGRYDVLHAHHDLVSGVYLWAAVGLPIRSVVHVHNSGEAVLTDHPVKKNLFRRLLRSSCLALSDRIIAVSNHSLDTLLAGRPRRPGRDQVVYSAVDGAAFAGPPPDRIALRQSLGLAPDARIMLFAGRMVPEKNPLFVVDILERLRTMEPLAVAVFAGSGPEESVVLERVRRLGMSGQVRLLGWRDDLPAIMRSADWFVLPSPEDVPEGFGLAVVEAQLAGLRMLLSRGIADDPILPSAHYRRLALADGPHAWANAAMDLLQEPDPNADEALAALASSSMNPDRALANLVALHT